MSYDLDDIIEHYGVKGMKWGVRKDPDRVAARKKARADKKLDKADKKWEKKMSYQRMTDAHQEASDRTLAEQDKVIDKIQKTKDFKKAISGDNKAMDRINDRFAKDITPILNEYMSKQADLVSPSGKKAVQAVLQRMDGELFPVTEIVTLDKK